MSQVNEQSDISTLFFTVIFHCSRNIYTHNSNQQPPPCTRVIPPTASSTRSNVRLHRLSGGCFARYPRVHVSLTKPLCSPLKGDSPQSEHSANTEESAYYDYVPVQRPRTSKKETPDEHCRRVDRYYEQLADQLIRAKKDRNGVKELKDGARSSHDYRKWDREYQRLYAKVEVLKRNVEDEKAKVLRRYPM